MPPKRILSHWLNKEMSSYAEASKCWNTLKKINCKLSYIKKISDFKQESMLTKYFKEASHKYKEIYNTYMSMLISNSIFLLFWLQSAILAFYRVTVFLSSHCVCSHFYISGRLSVLHFCICMQSFASGMNASYFEEDWNTLLFTSWLRITLLKYWEI